MSNAFVRLVLEIACWVSAAILLGVFFGGRAFGEFERRQAVASFASMRAAAEIDVPRPANGDDDLRHGRPEIRAFLPQGGGDPGPSATTPDQSEWSPARVREYAASVADPALAESAPVALLRIERVGLEVPVYADIDERNLNRGAGLVAGTAAPDGNGNVAIAAHRDGYFRALRNVAIGDLLELESAAQSRAYRISEISVVDPSDVSVLQETAEPAVTLVTCYPFFFVGNAPQRFIVRALAEQ